MQNLNYKHLRYFWVAAKEGSITKASEILHITPQTISGQLSQLEESLGVKLFKKSGRQIKITKEGMTVLHYANDIFELGTELESVIKRNITSLTPTLYVGIADAVPKLVACQVLKPSFESGKKIKLVCYEDKLETLLADLAIHKLDIVLADAPLTPNINVRAFNHLLGECGTSFFAREDIVEDTATFPELLNDYPLLIPTRHSAFRGDMDLWLEHEKITPHIAAEFDDSALMKAFGQAGVGVFAAPSSIEEEIVRQHRVNIVGRTSQLKHQYYAISTDRKISHPAILAICERARKDIFIS